MAEPTPEMIEAGARALFEDPFMPAEMTWDEVVKDDPTRAEFWRADAARVLSAALAEGTEEPEWEATTPRGFGYTEIKVANYAGHPERTFSIQQSSLATECQVWIGLDDDRAHMNVEQAARVRDALNAFLASAWLPVNQGDEQTPNRPIRSEEPR